MKHLGLYAEGLAEPPVLHGGPDATPDHVVYLDRRSRRQPALLVEGEENQLLRTGLTVAFSVLVLVSASCDSSTSQSPPTSASSDAAVTPPGCGWVQRGTVAGIVDGETVSREHGSLDRPPRADGGRITCTTTGRGVVRSLTIGVLRHPAPLSLASRPCNSGWVYAGTPDHNVPACQTAVQDGGRTRVLARADDYVITVVLLRRDRNWGGDPEAGLKISDEVARTLEDSASSSTPPSTGS